MGQVRKKHPVRKTLKFMVFLAAWCRFADAASAATVTMTFDSITEGSAFARNAVYEENGIRATCQSDYASFADPLNGFANTPLYFHGTGHYIEFRLVSGVAFDLKSFWLTSNGYANRWIMTEKNPTQVSIGMPTTPTLKEFSGTNYTGITWFRIGTPWYATEVDTIVVEYQVGSAPYAFSLSSPAQGAALYSTNALLDWADSGGADSYEVFLGQENPPARYGGPYTNSQLSVGGLEEQTSYYWYVLASNQYGSTRSPETGAWSFATAETMDVLFTTNAVISATHTNYEGLRLLVNAATVTVDGAHSFSNLHLINGAVLTHPAGTATNYGFLDLSVAGTLLVGGNSAIQTAGKGYAAGRTAGNSTNAASTGRSGGSYGGLGGTQDGGAANLVYGDFRNPNEPGSGAATTSSGGAGGGLVRIAASRMELNGTINANGAVGASASGYSGGAGGGSGGGVFLVVDTLAGTGTVSALGGAAGVSGGYIDGARGGGGGGGRVAIVYGSLDGFNIENQVTVLGGDGGGTNDGSAGTLFVQSSGPGELIINSRNVARGTPTPLWLPAGTNYFDHVTIKGSGQVVEVWSDNFLPSNLVMMGGSVLSHPLTTTGRVYEVNLAARGMILIGTNCTVNASGRGYGPGRTSGNAVEGASTYLAGGSYGGVGGHYGTGVACSVYGDYRNPGEPGSGASPVNSGGAGGGLVRLSAPRLELHGTIVAGGAAGASSSGCPGGGAGGAGGGVYLDVHTLSGTGTIWAVGGAAGAAIGYIDGCRAGGGGGGRVAIFSAELEGFVPSSNAFVTGGDGGGTNDGGVGTLFYTNRVAPVMFTRFSPSGQTNGTVSEIALRVSSPLVSGSLALEDMILKDPSDQTVALSSLAATGPVDYRLALASPAAAEGAYVLTIGTNLASLLGGVPERATTNRFTLDHGAPAAPTVTNFLASPSTNRLRATSALLAGRREAEASVWWGAQRLAYGAGTNWSATVAFTQGVNEVALHARDTAGNISETNAWLFLADTVAPAITAVSPGNGAWATSTPAFVRLTYLEATSGLEAPRCTYAVTKNGVTLPGEWVLTTTTLVFTPAGTMVDGAYAVSAKLYDTLANTGATYNSTFSVDTVPPDPPVLNPITSPTTINQQTITGTRGTGTSTYVYRNDSMVGSQSGGGTNWSYTISLTNGWNYWGFAAIEASGNQSVRTNVAILYNNVAPVAVTVTAQVNGVGTQLTLLWTNYNELTAGGDIALYHVYQADGSFANVSQAAQIGTRPPGYKSFVVTGLVRGVTKHYAVMARDTAGLANSNVTSLAAAPVDTVAPPNPTGAVFVCGATNLSLSWSASADPDADLAGYRVYPTSAVAGIEYSPTNRLHEQGGLAPSTSYVFRVAAYDQTGNEGGGLVVTGYTVLPNPTGLSITPYDGFVELSWHAVSPTSFVRHYAIYASTNEYASVTGLAARATATATNTSVAGFQNGVTNWFAVTTVNKSGGERPEVVPVAAATVDDVWGPTLLNLKWQGGSAAGPATWPGSFTVQARDPIGISRVEFEINGASLPVTSSGSTNFSAFWDVNQTVQNGAHTLVVKGYDTKGNETVVTQAVTVALALPPAPVLTSPLGTTFVSRTWQSASGTGALYAAAVRWYANGTCIATSIPSANGSFSATLDLQDGTNRITAAAVNRAGTGTVSGAATVILDRSVPAAPIGVTAVVQADGAIRIGWTEPPGGSVKGYNLYRANDPFDSVEQAARVNASLLTTKVYSDVTPSDRVYYYRVSAFNLADTEGLLSAEVSAVSDREPPRVVSIEYATDGPWISAEERYGPGTITVDLNVSEALQTTPFFSLNPVSGLPISMALSRISSTLYRGSFAVSDSSPCGAVYATFSGRDIAGNRGTEIQGGGVITLDACGPILAELNVTPAAPIRNSAANPTTVTVVAVFNADDMPTGAPVLKWSLSQTRPAETAVALSPLTERSWWGTVTLPSGAGQPTEYLAFSYEASDTLGNTGRTISTESRFEVYQGGLPPLPAPEGLTVAARPAGEIALTWRAVAGAADYAVFRGAASNALSYASASGGPTNYSETPGDATNWYAVASVRSANGQVSTGALSEAVRVVSDATAPGAPSSVTLSLYGTGIRMNWQAPGGESVRYSTYRGTQDFASVTGLAPRSTNIATAYWTDPSPAVGAAYYAVVAHDAVGNVSPVSERAYTNLALLPVNSLAVRRTWGGLPSVSWTHGHVAGISGFNLYAGEEGAETLLNGSLGSTATQHVDTGYTEGSRRYVLAAADEQGGVEVESVRRALVLPDLRAGLPTNTVILRGVMSRLLYTVTNAGSTAVAGAQLYAVVQGVSHVSEPFGCPAGGRTSVAVVVGGYTNLGPRVTLTNRVELVPNAGELVQLTSTSDVEVGTGMIVAEVLNDELVRGTEGQIRFALHNTSSEELEVVLAQNGNASPEVRVKLEDADGMVYASASARQTLGDKVVTVANGQTVARIPAGESFTSGNLALPIPLDAPDNVVLKLEIDQLHYHVARTDHVQISGLKTTRAVSLSETWYYAEVTNVAPAVSFGDTNILIRGRAVNRAGGQGEANAAVKLVISVDGFERSYTLYSDAAGGWSYSFSPLAGEAGTYKVWAVHPSVVAKPEQAGFVIARVAVSPATVNIGIPRNYAQTVPVTVTPSRGNTLTNLTVSCLAADQPGGAIPAGIHVTATAGVAVAQGGQAVSLPFRFSGDATAASTGRVNIRVASAGAPVAGWSQIAVNYSLHEALPVLQWTPNYVYTGVAVSNSDNETVVLKNAGYAALEGVTLALRTTNGAAAPEWIRLNASTNVGTLAVGEERALTLTVAPTAGVAETTHEFRLHVQAQNHAARDINVFVSVDGSGRGGLLFKVTDIYTGTTNQQGGLVQGLQGATIALQRESGTPLLTNKATDVLGEASFDDLPVGSYVLRVSATKHDTYGGRVWVRPGMVNTKEVFLPYNLVTVEWKVVPILIEDRYEVVLNATFETDVPAPVVVIEPASVTLPDMLAGDVFNIELRVVNYGLTRAENVSFALPPNDQYLRFELLTPMPETLEAKQVVTIPYRITCLQSLVDTGDGGGGGSAPCGTHCSSCSYDYSCISGNRTSGRATGGCVSRPCTGSSSGGLAGGGTYNYGFLVGGGSSGSGTPPAASVKTPEGNVGCHEACDYEENPCCVLECAGSSVSMAGGSYHDEETDLAVKVLGGYAMIQRSYAKGGWLFPTLQLRMPIDAIQALFDVPIAHQVSKVPFLASVTSNEVARGVVGLSLDTDGEELITERGDRFLRTAFGWRWTHLNGDWIDFGEDGRPLRSGNSKGWQIQYAYDAATNVVGLLDHFSNQVLWIEYEGFRVISARDAAVGGRQVLYQYDSAGSLTNVVGVDGGNTAYAYDSEQRMVLKRHPGGKERHITYRADGAIGSVLDAEGGGREFVFDYDEGKNQYYSSVRMVGGGMINDKWFDTNFVCIAEFVNGEEIHIPSTTLQEAASPLVRIDASANPVEIRQPSGATQRYQYDPGTSLMARMVDELGVTNIYQRNPQGDVTNRILAAGTPYEQRTVSIYDEARRLSAVTTFGGSNDAPRTTLLDIDSRGRLTRITDAAGGVTLYGYDNQGNVTSVRDAESNAWFFAYDAMGREVLISDPTGATTSNRFDLAGNLVERRDAMGGRVENSFDTEGRILSSASYPNGETWLWRYDGAGRVQHISSTDGSELEMVYDPVGLLVQILGGNGSAFSADYDDYGRLERVVDQYGQFVEVEYDPDSALPHRVRRAQSEMELRYNAWGWVTSMVETIQGESVESVYDYDVRGQTVAVTVDGEPWVQWGRDALGRVVERATPFTTNSIGYDRYGNIALMVDGKGGETHIDYDILDRPILRVFPNGKETRLSYNKASWLTNYTDAAGRRMVFAYDGVGRCTSLWAFASETDVSPEQTCRFEYDANGKLIGFGNDTAATRFAWDAASRTLAVTTDFGAFEKTYWRRFDALGRVIAAVSPEGGTNEFAYDALGRTVSMTAQGVGAFSFSDYGPRGPGQIHFPGGTVQQIRWHPAFGLATNHVRDPSGQTLFRSVRHYSRYGLPDHVETGDGDLSLTYDAQGRLTSAMDSLLGLERFYYDAVDNMVSNPSSGSSWLFDEMQQLRQTEEGAFEYDGNGNLTSGVIAGVACRLEWDARNQLKTIRSGEGAVVASYAYDAMGRRVRKEVGGEVTWFLYGAEGLMAEYDAEGHERRSYAHLPGAIWNSEPLYQKEGELIGFYIIDSPMTPVALVSANGSLLWKARYESFGLAHVEQSLMTNAWRGSGQYYDAESGLHYNTARYYDPAHRRYLSRDPALRDWTRSNPYVFVDNDPLTYVDPSGLEHFLVDFTKDCHGNDKKYESAARLPGSDQSVIPGYSQASRVVEDVFNGTVGRVPLLGNLVKAPFQVLPYTSGARYSGCPGKRYEFYVPPDQRAKLLAHLDTIKAVYNHGYNDEHPETRGIEFHGKVKTILGQDVDMLTVKWPGSQYFGPYPPGVNFRQATDIAREDVAKGLELLMRCVASRRPDGVIPLSINHSLGNRPFLEALSHGQLPYIQNALLWQGAVPARWVASLDKSIRGGTGRLGYTFGDGDTVVGMIYAIGTGRVGLGGGQGGRLYSSYLPDNAMVVFDRSKGHSYRSYHMMEFMAESVKGAPLTPEESARVYETHLEGGLLLRPDDVDRFFYRYTQSDRAGASLPNVNQAW